MKCGALVIYICLLCGLGLHVLIGHFGSIWFLRLIQLTEGENRNNHT
jgi:hypothetical protein